jgi:ABC-type branched-subunit amino acid transport system substrate-binding protein
MKKQNFKITALLLIAVMLVGFINSCKKDDNDKPEPPYIVTLGVILPMDNDNGQLRENAIRTAINEINANGGVGGGYNIELIVRSSEGENREVAAAAAANDIISNATNLIGFVTSYSTSSKGVVTQVSEPGHYPTISGSATAENLSGFSDYFQRLCPPDNYQANVLAQKANEVGITTVAIAVEENDFYSEGLSENFQTVFGAGVVAEVKFIKNDPGYVDKLNLLLADSPDAIFISMLDSDVYVEFIDRLYQINKEKDLTNTHFILCDALHSKNIFDAHVEIMIGEISGKPKNFGALSFPDTTTIAYEYFAEKLMEKYGQQVGSFNAQFYDIGYIFALAIEEASYFTGLDNMELFRETVNEFVRIVTNFEFGDFIVYPNDGWSEIKQAADIGGVDYFGASGNCNIDDEGNTMTPFLIFKIVGEGGDYSFEGIEYINP